MDLAKALSFDNKTIRMVKPYLIAVFLLSIVLMFFDISPAIILFVALGILSMYPMRFVTWLGIELSVFFTVLSASLYGFSTGVLVACMIVIIGSFVANLLGIMTFYNLLALIVIAYLAAGAGISNIAIMGTIFLMLYHLGAVFFQKGLGIFDHDSILFAAVNIIFSLMFFWRIAPFLTGLLS